MRPFLRLRSDVNERLRFMMRHSAEFSCHAAAAITSTDLATVELAARDAWQERTGSHNDHFRQGQCTCSIRCEAAGLNRHYSCEQRISEMAGR